MCCPRVIPDVGGLLGMPGLWQGEFLDFGKGETVKGRASRRGLLRLSKERPRKVDDVKGGGSNFGWKGV